jgi:hypothetical protein
MPAQNPDNDMMQVMNPTALNGVSCVARYRGEFDEAMELIVYLSLSLWIRQCQV